MVLRTGDWCQPSTCLSAAGLDTTQEYALFSPVCPASSMVPGSPWACRHCSVSKWRWQIRTGEGIEDRTRSRPPNTDYPWGRRTRARSWKVNQRKWRHKVETDHGVFRRQCRKWLNGSQQMEHFWAVRRNLERWAGRKKYRWSYNKRLFGSATNWDVSRYMQREGMCALEAKTSRTCRIGDGDGAWGMESWGQES